ncbi:hypothetical protein ACTRW9_12750 [Nitrospina sp. 32_T5]|uniref:hypothetical protein n=1 Tax=unclassified Nitrospina TaxID=2638683 RepID=UPI003F94F031
METVLIQRQAREPFKFPKQSVVRAVKSGELYGDDKISADGKSWVRLDEHKQLKNFFYRQSEQVQLS